MNLTDKLNSVSPEAAVRAAFVIVDALQDRDPAEQVAAAALLYVSLIRRFNVDGREALIQAERRLRDALSPDVNRTPGEYARAIQQYIGAEL